MKKVNLRVRNFEEEQFLTYNIHDEATLDEDVLDFLEDEEPKGLVPIIYDEEEENDTFSYDITGKICMFELSKQDINAEMVLKVMRGLVLSLIDMGEYRVPLSYLVLNSNFIYIDSNYEVEFVCIPVEEMQETVDLNAFLRNFLASLRFEPSENGDYVAKMLTYINNTAIFNLRNMLNLVESLMDVYGVEVPEDTDAEIYVDYQEIDEETEEAEAAVDVVEAMEELEEAEETEEEEVAVDVVGAMEESEAAVDVVEAMEELEESEAAIDVVEAMEELEEAEEAVEKTEESEVAVDVVEAMEELEEAEEEVEEPEESEVAVDVVEAMEELEEAEEEVEEPEESEATIDVVEAMEELEEAQEEVEEPEVAVDVVEAMEELEEAEEEVEEPEESEAAIDVVEAMEELEEVGEKTATASVQEPKETGATEVLTVDMKVGGVVNGEKLSGKKKVQENVERDVDSEVEEILEKARQDAKKPNKPMKTTLKTKEAVTPTRMYGDDLDEILAELEQEELKAKTGKSTLKIKREVKVNRASIVLSNQEESKETQESVEVQVEEVQEPVQNQEQLKKKADIPKVNPYIIRVNTKERVMITKQNFKIGKASMGVDYRVRGNGAVSRVHAIITNKDDVYYIKDNKSTNHTIVNGKVLEDGDSEVLVNGCTILLGDEEFVFKMG